MMSCPIKPRWERRKDARPQELLAAALDLFVERGFAATRLDDVAKAAGVSKGTLYLYFCSKEELFKAVVRENLVQILGEAAEIVDQFSGTTEELFRTLMLRWWEHMGESKLSGLPKLMIAEAGNFPELASFYQDEVITPTEALFQRMLQRGIERQEVRPVDLEMDVRLLIAPMIMMMIWQQPCSVCKVDKKDIRKYLEHYINNAMQGLLLRQ